MSGSFFSFSEPFNTGVDFYEADSADVKIVSSGSVDLTVSVTRVAISASSLSGSADASISATKIIHIQSSIQIEGVTVTVANERQDGSVVISGDVSMSTSVMKIAYASCSISSSSSLSINGTRVKIGQASLSSDSSLAVSSIKIAKASANTSSSSSLTATAIGIRHIASLLSGTVNLSTAGRISLATISIQVLSNNTISAKTIKFSTVTGIDTTSYRTLLLIDGKPITDQSRVLDVSSAPMYIENRNWSGDSSRYFKNSSSASKKTFSLSWSFIPNFREKTVDQKNSRDFLKKIAIDPDVHVLKVINQDSSGTTPYTETVYNVLVKDYSENLIRRDIADSTYYFSCSMVLEEV